LLTLSVKRRAYSCCPRSAGGLWWFFLHLHPMLWPQQELRRTRCTNVYLLARTFFADQCKAGISAHRFRHFAQLTPSMVLQR